MLAAFRAVVPRHVSLQRLVGAVMLGYLILALGVMLFFGVVVFNNPELLSRASDAPEKVPVWLLGGMFASGFVATTLGGAAATRVAHGSSIAARVLSAFIVVFGALSALRSAEPPVVKVGNIVVGSLGALLGGELAKRPATADEARVAAGDEDKDE